MKTNMEMAQEFAQDRGHDNQSITEAFVAALDMADWKDEQLRAEKEALIDKACKIISDKVGIYINFYGDNDYSFDKQGFLRQFKQVMKGE